VITAPMRGMAEGRSIWDEGLEKNHANHIALTPLTFFARAAAVFPEREAVVYGAIRRGWAETYRRCCRLASALRRIGIQTGDTVAVIGTNTPEMFEAHFGVPMAGAVLNAINTRLDAETIAFILDHSETRVLLVDREFSRTVARALGLMDRPPVVIDIDDPAFEGGELLGSQDYEAFIATGDPDYAWEGPADEWQAIAVNYTPSATSRPRGAVHHHRGAYLNAMANVLMWEMGKQPVFLWTVPMFHCNGWCFPWSAPIVAATSVCLRDVRAEAIFEAVRNEGVTLFSGAPIILSMIDEAPEAMKTNLPHQVGILTGGASPPAPILEEMERLGFAVSHGYGLTEVFGLATICVWRDEWNALPIDERARMRARQGVRSHVVEALMVADPVTLDPVPQDGRTVGEVFIRGNAIMKGYLKDPAGTAESFRRGWFRTGDLAVWHDGGYVEIKDRSKEIIISGGENISSQEVETILLRHPAVLEAAVVAKPDPKWGESPCAFVTLRDDLALDERDIISFCRQHLAHYKVPRSIVFGPLPKSAGGTVQKSLLRERAKQLGLLI